MYKKEEPMPSAPKTITVSLCSTIVFSVLQTIHHIDAYNINSGQNKLQKLCTENHLFRGMVGLF